MAWPGSSSWRWAWPPGGRNRCSRRPGTGTAGRAGRTVRCDDGEQPWTPACLTTSRGLAAALPAGQPTGSGAEELGEQSLVLFFGEVVGPVALRLAALAGAKPVFHPVALFPGHHARSGEVLPGAVLEADPDRAFADQHDDASRRADSCGPAVTPRVR